MQNAPFHTKSLSYGLSSRACCHRSGKVSRFTSSVQVQADDDFSKASGKL